MNGIANSPSYRSVQINYYGAPYSSDLLFVLAETLPTALDYLAYTPQHRKTLLLVCRGI